MPEPTLSRKTVYEGKILDLEVQEVAVANGRSAVREIVRHGPAVAILCKMRDGRFLFVRQFRKAVEQDLLEVVAGNRDEGEDAETCARRELEEETGYRASRMIPLGYIYPSPGYVDERIDLFWAELEAEAGSARPDDDEELTLVALERAEVEQLLRDNVSDSKTLAIWLRAQLRGLL